MNRVLAMWKNCYTIAMKNNEPLIVKFPEPDPGVAVQAVNIEEESDEDEPALDTT